MSGSSTDQKGKRHALTALRDTSDTFTAVAFRSGNELMTSRAADFQICRRQIARSSARHSINENDVNHAIIVSLTHMKGTRNRIANKSTTFCCSACTQNKAGFVFPESVDLIFAHD
jgi:hypothetical protein